MAPRGNRELTILLRSRRFQVLNATAISLISLMILVGASGATSNASRIVEGGLAVVGLLLAVRATRSATMLINEDKLVVRRLLTTSYFDRAEIQGFGVEVGPVVVLRRAYPTLIRSNTPPEKLTEFARSPSKFAELESLAIALGQKVRLPKIDEPLAPDDG